MAKMWIQSDFENKTIFNHPLIMNLDPENYFYDEVKKINYWI